MVRTGLRTITYLIKTYRYERYEHDTPSHSSQIRTSKPADARAATGPTEQEATFQECHTRQAGETHSRRQHMRRNAHRKGQQGKRTSDCGRAIQTRGKRHEKGPPARVVQKARYAIGRRRYTSGIMSLRYSAMLRVPSMKVRMKATLSPKAFMRFLATGSLRGFIILAGFTKSPP